MYHINNTLLILLVILLIFCILYLFYNGHDFSKLIYYDSSIDDRQLVMEIITSAKNNAIQQIKEMGHNELKNKERFLVDNRQLLQNNAINYNDSLDNINEWIKNINEPNGMLAQIKKQLLIGSRLRQEEKENILQNITDIYILAYLEQINKANKVSYKVFDKYKTPSENKYYKQYTR